jgi:site-specific DNA-cytosine methylase
MSCQTLTFCVHYLEKIGYFVVSFRLCARQFGFPVSRERVYMLAVREDIASAQKAWGAFSKIHRLCAERLTDVDSQRGLAGMSFAAFVSSQAGTSLLLELEESLESKGKRAAAQMLATYRLVEHGSNGLSNN